MQKFKFYFIGISASIGYLMPNNYEKSKWLFIKSCQGWHDWVTFDSPLRILNYSNCDFGGYF